MSAEPLRKALSPQFSNDFIFISHSGIIFMDLAAETGKSYVVQNTFVLWKYFRKFPIFVGQKNKLNFSTTKIKWETKEMIMLD